MTPSLHDLMKKSIVLVEDDKNFSGLVRDLRKNVDLLFLGDAELVVLQSLEMLKHVVSSTHVVLAVLDLALPDSPQAETINFIRREAHTFPAPIFILTGDERIEVRRECLFSGAVGFALKKHIIESPNFFFADLYNAYLVGLDHGS